MNICQKKNPAKSSKTGLRFKSRVQPVLSCCRWKEVMIRFGIQDRNAKGQMAVDFTKHKHKMIEQIKKHTG